MSTPPADETNVIGPFGVVTLVATPPVIVTPLSETVNLSASTAPATPIVSTGPPPRIVVRPAPEPTTVTLLSSVTPPAYVPGAIRIVSPSTAASKAGCNEA